MGTPEKSGLVQEWEDEQLISPWGGERHSSADTVTGSPAIWSNCKDRRRSPWHTRWRCVMSGLISLFSKIHIASPAQVATTSSPKGNLGLRVVSLPPTRLSNSSKPFPNLKHKRGFFRIKGCTSNFDDNAKSLTDTLIGILSKFDYRNSPRALGGKRFVFALTPSSFW